MATLIKQHEGLMFEETFSENSLIWSLTPSNVDCLRFDPDGLHILHNSEYITYTMKETEDEYCVVVRIDHTPVTEGDIAGVIIMSDTNDYAECQSYQATSPSNIGNNGENISFGYDLSDHYVRYSFDDNQEDEDEESGSSGDEGEGAGSSSVFVDKIYQFIKFVKYNNVIGPTYRFYASANGIDDWIEVGTVNFNKSCSIGFFLYAARDNITLNRGKFVINSFYMYENKYIIINGIKEYQEFEIYSPQLDATILRSDTTTGQTLVGHYQNYVTIDTTGIMMPLNDAWIRIYPKDHFNDTIAQFDMENLTFGGDIFNISYDIQLRIDNEIINSGDIYDLGYIYKDSFKRNVVIYNNDDIDLISVKVSIIAFSEYYSGEEVIKIAIYDRNNENSNHSDQEIESLRYSDSVTIPLLSSHSGVELIMKLSDMPRQEFYTVANKYRFKLLIE